MRLLTDEEPFSHRFAFAIPGVYAPFADYVVSGELEILPLTLSLHSAPEKLNEWQFFDTRSGLG